MVIRGNLLIISEKSGHLI